MDTNTVVNNQETETRTETDSLSFTSTSTSTSTSNKGAQTNDTKDTKYTRRAQDTNDTIRTQGAQDPTWIRGVNIGGWLLAERFITPYLFAVNSCHLAGDLCWYEGQVGIDTANDFDDHSAHSDDDKYNFAGHNKYNTSNICNPAKCTPIRPLRVMDGNADYHPRKAQPYMDYPIDEYTLGQTLANNQTLALEYMERHWDTFVTRHDLEALKEAGVTHLRIPLSFWIRGNVLPGEPWISGGWKYFIRVAHWCRSIGLTIWADLHGAPGSENGFDNSGQYLGRSTCEGWTQSAAANVERTLDILTDLAQGIADEGLTDVITGFGLLNEPFLDCDQGVIHNYYNNGLEVVRRIMGPDTSVFVGDTFRAWKFNDGQFWTDPLHHYETYLDSHPYQVFFEKGRAFTPRQHIAYVCRHGQQDVESCCWDDAPTNTVPSKGISRIIGEWSAAYDVLPTALTPHIMKTIGAVGKAPLLNRTLSSTRMEFMRRYVEAQMVTYESRDNGIASGWLFWNFKMEGGAFAEWDFLRGIREGWMPPIPDPTVASQDLYGTCYEIYNRTAEDYEAIVDEYPDPRTLDWAQYQGWDANDDFVLSDPTIPTFHYVSSHPAQSTLHMLVPLLILMAGLVFICRRNFTRSLNCWNHGRGRRSGYEQVK